jgi:hypothetical protein
MNTYPRTSGHVSLQKWKQHTRQLLLHAPLRSKQNSLGTTNLAIVKDICNPEKWAVALQTDSGMHVISVHNSRDWAASKIQRMKNGWSIAQENKEVYKSNAKAAFIGRRTEEIDNLVDSPTSSLDSSITIANTRRPSTRW